MIQLSELSPGFGPTPAGMGPPPGFVAFGILIVVVGIGLTFWKVATAQRIARDAGMDPGDATTMALLSDHGFEATYLAASLRGQVPPSVPQPSAADQPGAADRLRELATLHAQGLITDEELATRRAAVIDGI